MFHGKGAGTGIPFTSPKAFESLKIDFQHSVKRATLETYRKALQTGFDYLKEQSGKHNLTTLRSLFITYKDENDLCDLIQSYLATNIGFKTYRYSAKDDNLKESISHTDITATEARNLLYLIRCHEVSKGVISEQSKAHIAKMKRLETYIENARETKTLGEFYKELPEVKTKHIKNIFNGQRINERTELNKIIKANLYLLTYNHKEFTTTEKGGRIFNALTNLSRTYRENEFPFQVKEYDIKSANPQIIDNIFNWNNYKNVYSNLMQPYNISRDKAKELFNSTLNNHRLSRSKAIDVYLKSGYSEKQANELASITSGVEKGTFYRYMAKHEAEIINEFTGINFNDKNFIRLHDAVFIEPEFSDLDNVKFNADYGTETTSKANISLDLSIDTDKTILTAPVGKNIVRKHINGLADVVYKGDYFTFYDTEFEVLNANFNINKPLYSNDLAKVKSKEDIFMQRIEKLYYIINYLNQNYREDKFAFEINEKKFDIKNANPTIVDRIFNWRNYKDVYSNLMQSYNISRDKAKELFNSTLNNHRLSRSKAIDVYLKSGYSEKQANELASITSGVEKGTFYRYMAKHEAEIINEIKAMRLNNRKFKNNPINKPIEKFKNCIDYIGSHQGISFNKNYIYIKMKEWEYTPEKAKRYIKIRNWEYNGHIQKNRYDFQQLYYKELRECKDYYERIRVKRELLIMLRDFERYGTINAIDKSKYDRKGNTRHIIKKIDELIGIKKVCKLEEFNSCVQKIAHPIRHSYIGRTKNCTPPQSDKKLSEQLNINRRFAKQVNYILNNRTEIMTKLSNAIANLETLQNVEDLFNDPVKEVEALKPVTPQKAFDDARNDKYLQEWNNLNRHQKNIYLNNNVNGYLEWKAQTRATA